MRSAPETFGSRRDAEQWLTVIESEVLRVIGRTCLLVASRSANTARNGSRSTS
jgi:hypothetical protein